MQIRAIPEPAQWTRWNEAKALLEPARARGDFADVIEPDEALFAVEDGDELLAVATAWLGTDNATGIRFCEVKLIGGRDHRRWLRTLDEAIGERAAAAGAAHMLAIGRRGWMRSIERLGWVKHGETEDMWIFTRALKD
jgi:hypothetical protein